MLSGIFKPSKMFVISQEKVVKCHEKWCTPSVECEMSCGYNFCWIAAALFSIWWCDFLHIAYCMVHTKVSSQNPLQKCTHFSCCFGFTFLSPSSSTWMMNETFSFVSLKIRGVRVFVVSFSESEWVFGFFLWCKRCSRKILHNGCMGVA